MVLWELNSQYCSFPLLHLLWKCCNYYYFFFFTTVCSSKLIFPFGHCMHEWTGPHHLVSCISYYVCESAHLHKQKWKMWACFGSGLVNLLFWLWSRILINDRSRTTLSVLDCLGSRHTHTHTHKRGCVLNCVALLLLLLFCHYMRMYWGLLRMLVMLVC